jgi:hypothetical protein
MENLRKENTTMAAKIRTTGRDLRHLIYVMEAGANREHASEILSRLADQRPTEYAPVQKWQFILPA